MDWILEQISTQNILRLPEYDLSDLDYADDVALLDASPANLASASDLLQARAAQLGINVSWQKTKLQFLGDTTITDNITVRGQAVETVDDFVYLGSVQSSDITRRIGLAASAMRSLHTLWRQQKIQLSTRLAIYHTCVLPVLLYEAETWTLT